MKKEILGHRGIIRLAIAIEQKGYEIYSNAVKHVDQETAKNILIYLAEQEKQHEDYFRKIEESMSGEDKWFSDEMDDKAIKYISVLSADILNDTDNALNHAESLLKVVEAAKQSEKDSILFYIELVKYAPDQHTYDIFKKLVNEEKKHLMQLEELKNLIEERDVYY